MTLYDHVKDLDLTVESCELSLRERDVSSEFTRTTTVVELSGDGETGRGEDVTYEAEHHHALVGAGGPGDEPNRGGETAAPFDLEGDYELDGFSDHVGELDLFPGDEPRQEVFRSYRRWALESAALDLALRQADTDLGTALGREHESVRFVVSTRLGEPPSYDRVAALLDVYPRTELKLDPTDGWDDALVARLQDTGAVRVLDMKGAYEDVDLDVSDDAALYDRVVEAFPDAVVEDPALTDETRRVLEGHESRVSWDYPIRSVESIQDLPWEPSWINVKPSRFGSVESLLDSIEHCLDDGIRMYGGGQFELDVGRRQIQALASLLYPDGPNDVAPGGYNEPEVARGLPESPLEPGEPRGFGWG